MTYKTTDNTARTTFATAVRAAFGPGYQVAIDPERVVGLLKASHDTGLVRR